MFDPRFYTACVDEIGEFLKGGRFEADALGQVWNTICLTPPVNANEKTMRPILLVLFGMLAAGLLLACLPRPEAHSYSDGLHPRFMAEDGYQPATIRIEESATCPVLFETERGQLCEPLYVPDALKTDGQLVWVKYETQRRPSRCEAQSVAIVDIKKRER